MAYPGADTARLEGAPGLTRAELARVAVDLGGEGHPVVFVVAGPGDQALLERVAEAGEALPGARCSQRAPGQLSALLRMPSSSWSR